MYYKASPPQPHTYEVSEIKKVIENKLLPTNYSY
jgi:hypothetical protein